MRKATLFALLVLVFGTARADNLSLAAARATCSEITATTRFAAEAGAAGRTVKETEAMIAAFHFFPIDKTQTKLAVDLGKAGDPPARVAQIVYARCSSK